MKKKNRRIWTLVGAALLLFTFVVLLQSGDIPSGFKTILKPLQVMLPYRAAQTLREGALQFPENEKVMTLQRFSFERGQESLKNWEEKLFKGHTVFKIEHEKNLFYLRCQSRDACSGLYVKTAYPATPDMHLEWKWRVNEFPQKKHPEILASRAEDDFAARVYVIFLGSNFFKSNAIEYIWDEQIPVGTLSDSAYSERIKLLVIRSGPVAPVIGESGGWVSEDRNIYEDYLKLFGKSPRNPVGLVALMSDSDNTETKASADFAEIVLKRKQTPTAV